MRFLPAMTGSTAVLFVLLVSNANAGTPYAPLLDGSKAAAEYLKTVARNSCVKVDKACSKDSNGRRCPAVCQGVPVTTVRA